MYKLLNINGKDYKLEYGIEASLYNDCIKNVMNTLLSISGGVGQNVGEIISGMSDIPRTAVVVFYAGLIQYHGTHADGDGTVPDLATAKKLIAQYISEHKDDDQGNFYGVFNMCLEQMETDGFFELTGMTEIMNKINEVKPKKAPKKPTDHQKKATAK